jgi:hypothetical protein
LTALGVFKNPEGLFICAKASYLYQRGVITGTMKSIFTFIFLLLASHAFAQNAHKNPSPCKPNYDSTQAVELILATYDTARMPVAKLIKEDCKWQVTFFTAAFTLKGDCKNTNGCSILTHYVSTLDARTGKLETRMDRKEMIANRE